MTNLRLPGQHDERLFAAAGISGMQGPYYNWNRWYLPSVGRYLEPDPIAMAGGFNGFYGPNWYGYAESNPLRHTDTSGKLVVADDILVAAGAAALLTLGYKLWLDYVDALRETNSRKPWEYPREATPPWLTPRRPQPPDVPPVNLGPDVFPNPDKGDDNDGTCKAQYQFDLMMCRAIGRNRCAANAARCYETALGRLNACLKGIRPLPPLDTLNQGF